MSAAEPPEEPGVSGGPAHLGARLANDDSEIEWTNARNSMLTAHTEGRQQGQAGPPSVRSDPTCTPKKALEKSAESPCMKRGINTRYRCRHIAAALQVTEAWHVPSLLTLIFAWLLMCCVVSLGILIIWSSSKALETAGHAVFAARGAGGEVATEEGAVAHNGWRRGGARTSRTAGEKCYGGGDNSHRGNTPWPPHDIRGEAKGNSSTKVGTQEAKDRKWSHFTPGSGLPALTANLTCMAKRMLAVPLRVLGGLGDWARRLSNCSGKCEQRDTTVRQEPKESLVPYTHVSLSEVLIATEQVRSEISFIVRLALGAVFSSGIGAVSLATVLLNGQSAGRQWVLCTVAQTLIVLIIAIGAAWIFQPEFLTGFTWFHSPVLRASRRPG